MYVDVAIHDSHRPQVDGFDIGVTIRFDPGYYIQMTWDEARQIGEALTALVAEKGADQP